MRDILFKAKTEGGIWIEGDLIHYESGEMAILEKPFSKYGREATEIARRTKVLPETICQFTGFTDKNGNKIWENDVVYIPYVRLEDSYCKVIFRRGGFIGEMADGCEDCLLNRKTEVIGNIFDNPELLGEQNG